MLLARLYDPDVSANVPNCMTRLLPKQAALLTMLIKRAQILRMSIDRSDIAQPEHVESQSV